MIHENERKFLIADVLPYKLITSTLLMEVIYGRNGERAREIKVNIDGVGKTYYEACIKTYIGDGKSTEKPFLNPAKTFHSLASKRYARHIKYRYVIYQGGMKIEVDKFVTGPNAGFMLAEIEEYENNNFPLVNIPKWLGEDVTDRKEFSSSYIFNYALPDTLDDL